MSKFNRGDKVRLLPGARNYVGPVHLAAGYEGDLTVRSGVVDLDGDVMLDFFGKQSILCHRNGPTPYVNEDYLELVPEENPTPEPAARVTVSQEQVTVTVETYTIKLTRAEAVALTNLLAACDAPEGDDPLQAVHDDLAQAIGSVPGY